MKSYGTEPRSIEGRGGEVSGVIALKRINGSDIWLNPMLIESVERTPDSIVTLTNGHKYVIRESPEEIITKIQDFMRQVGLLGLVPRRGDMV
jgi:flagellar protein FlbD